MWVASSCVNRFQDVIEKRNRGEIGVKWDCYFWDSLALIIIFFSGTFGTHKWPHFVTLHSGSVTFSGILLKVATINYVSSYY